MGVWSVFYYALAWDYARVIDAQNDENRVPFLSFLSKPRSTHSGGHLFSPNPLSTRVLPHLIVMMNFSTADADTPASIPIRAKRIFGVAVAVEDMISIHRTERPHRIN